MSNLQNSYNKLTRQINQGVFNGTELLLFYGSLYSLGVIDQIVLEAGTVDLVFQTGAEIVFMEEYYILALNGSNVLIESYKGTLFTPNTPITTYNNNSKDNGVAKTLVYLNPVISDLGVKDKPDFVIRTGSREPLSTATRSPTYIYDNNEVYMFRITNRDAVTVSLDINGSFGESIGYEL